MGCDTETVERQSEASGLGEHVDFDKRRVIRNLLKMVRELPEVYDSEDSNRMTFLYFALSGLDVMGAIGELEESGRLVEWVYAQQVLPIGEGMEGVEVARCGFRGSGFAGAIRDENGKQRLSEWVYIESHLAMSYSALCCLVILGDDLSRVNKGALVRALGALQCEDGSFRPSHLTLLDNDLRYVYCACAISALLRDWSGVDRERTLDYIKGCLSYEYSFGQMPFQEAHGGGTYCAVASLALMGWLDRVGFGGWTSVGVAEGWRESTIEEWRNWSTEAQGMVHWLVNRQTSGFQGRVNKEVDSCYSWWTGASLRILGCWNLVDQERLRGYLIQCRDKFIGGFSKNPRSLPDLLHTYFSICGLSFVGEPGLERVHCALGISLRAAGQLAP